MPFKGQIVQVKKCHANELCGGLKVEDSEEEKETTGRVTGQVESAGVGICAPSPKNDCLGFY